MTKAKPSTKLLCVLFALMVAFVGLTFVGTANAATVSVGSSLFSKQNTTITSTTKGISIRPTEVYNSYATFSATQYLGEYKQDKPFSLRFTVVRDNFDKLDLVFTSEADKQDVDAYTEETLRKQDVENTLTIKKGSADSVENGVFTVKEVKGEYELNYNAQTATFTLSKAGSALGSYALDEAIFRNEAKVKFAFGAVDVHKPEVAQSKDEEDEEDYDACSILLTGINEQSFLANSSGRVEDTSVPVLRLNANEFAPQLVLNSTANVPLYGLDVVKASVSKPISMTVYFATAEQYEAEDFTWDNEDLLYKTVTSASFVPDKAGYYAIVEASYKDSTSSTANVTEKVLASDLDEIADYVEENGYIVFSVLEKATADKLSITEQQIEELGANAKYFDETKGLYFDEERYSAHYNAISRTVAGGTTNTVTFYTPVIFASDAAYDSLADVVEAFLDSDADFFSIAGINGEGKLVLETNSYLFTYTLRYRTATSTTYSSSSSLTFSQKSAGPYDFSLSVADRNTRSFEMKQNFIEKLSFYDIEVPEINVSNFPKTAYINQSITLPSASVTDDFDSSPTKTVIVYHEYDYSKYEIDEDGNVVVKDEDKTVVYLYKTDADGNFVDAEGNPLEEGEDKVMIYE
ncbi:MAG: hypothetical protein IJF71_07830, partial [Clostridia bacterium]|nr:hypothetical protein [Clostridia bacterium]